MVDWARVSSKPRDLPLRLAPPPGNTQPPTPNPPKVDEAYARWRLPSLLLWGANDPFIDTRSAFEFLETKVCWGGIGGLVL